MSRFEEAIAEAKKAVELDPVNVVSISTLGNIYYYARRYDLAEAETTKALELEPNYALGHFFLARVEKAFETRDIVLVRLKIDPAWDSSETTPAIPISSAASDSRPDYRI